MKIKVRIKNMVESSKVQGFLLSNGFERPYNNFVLIDGWLCVDGNSILCVGMSQAGSELDEYEEISIEQLHDMVVLKRNDPKDATHYRGDGKEYFQTCDKERYYHFQDDCWVLSTWMNYQLLPQLKPIQNNDLPFIDSEESLNDKVVSAEAARQEMKADNVNNPSHYNKGGIECIEAIKASMTHEAFCGYLKGNVQKYMWRYEVKGGVESLQKAQWYLNKLIECES